jgi:hypothetical protein
VRCSFAAAGGGLTRDGREDVTKLIGPRPFEDSSVAETLGEGLSGVSKPLGGAPGGPGQKGVRAFPPSPSCTADIWFRTTLASRAASTRPVARSRAWQQRACAYNLGTS